MLPRKIKHVVVGLSGGVDSAVAALLLKKKGYKVSGVYMRNWDLRDEEGKCKSDSDLNDASFVCDKLDVPLHEVNFVKEYWNDVFSSTLSAYENGLTPNPDILCNKFIKYDAFLDFAREKLEADYIATGHYAKSSAGEDMEKFNPKTGVRLLKAHDQWKDQTFFLSQVNQSSLHKALFPVGDFHKKIIKEIAIKAGLDKIAKKKESMGICFIGSRNFKNFIHEYIEPKTGVFIDAETKDIIGEHRGTHFWTLGQNAAIPGKAVKYFIAELHPKTNEIIVAPGTNHPALFTYTFFTKRPHWIHSPPRTLLEEQMFDCEFRFQHVHPLVKCTLTLSGNNFLIVSMSQPMRAVTPGQFAVFYKGEECLGSAEIIKTGPTLFTLSGDNTPVDNPLKFS